MELTFLDQSITDQAKHAVNIQIALGKEGPKKINSSELWDLFEKQLIAWKC